MPTFTPSARFRRDISKLTKTQRREFFAGLAMFIADLREIEAGNQRQFRAELVNKLRGVHGLYELRWAKNGRATFTFGDEQRPGLRHVEWHRCGTHDILP